MFFMGAGLGPFILLICVIEELSSPVIAVRRPL